MSEQTDQLLGALEWRYATKAFDATRKIPADVWAALEKTLILTPTSYGMQPYKFLIIENPAVRAQLLPHSWGQKQVVDASHFVVFTARTEIIQADVDRLINRTTTVRKLPPNTLGSYRNVIVGELIDGPRSKNARGWATNQAYIALGNLMTAAAVLKIDTCPMEGLVPAEYDKVLGLEKSGYCTVMACALGYRSPNDKYAALAKVRYEARELIQYI